MTPSGMAPEGTVSAVPIPAAPLSTRYGCATRPEWLPFLSVSAEVVTKSGIETDVSSIDLELIGNDPDQL